MLQESVVGLFLVYALVILQPFKEFAYMRLVQDDVPYIERIEQVARRDKRFDVLYVLGKLLIEHTRYTAVLRERGMEPSYRKYIESKYFLIWRCNIGHIQQIYVLAFARGGVRIQFVLLEADS